VRSSVASVFAHSLLGNCDMTDLLLEAISLLGEGDVCHLSNAFC